MGHSFSRPIPVIPYEEQDSFPTPLPPIPEDMNSVGDDYEIYVDHEDGQKIKARPKVNKKEIFIGPDGSPLPEDVQEQIRGYGSEDDSLSFLESFVNDDMARTNNIPDYVMDSLKRQYKGGSDYTIEDKKNVIDHYMNQRMRA